jgi:ubiquinone/menaquinone biosynthesis C-methylase UbiE
MGGRRLLMTGAFDRMAEEYDRWYDSPEGGAVFREELDCLRLLWSGPYDQWLEVGVGTGRFASALGVSQGVDPSPAMLACAARRGIRTNVGVAEALPYPDRSFDGVLVVATLSFVRDAGQALVECARVVGPNGTLLAGIIPAEGPWGREYARKAFEGHPVYSRARFLTTESLLDLAAEAGLELQESASALFWPPGSPPDESPRIERTASTRAGFVAMRFTVLGSG